MGKVDIDAVGTSVLSALLADGSDSDWEPRRKYMYGYPFFVLMIKSVASWR